MRKLDREYFVPVVILLLMLLGACSNPVDPDTERDAEEKAIEEEGVPVEPPAGMIRVEVTFEAIKIHADCDGDNIVTNRGDFAWRVGVSQEVGEGWSQINWVAETRGFGNSGGEVVKRKEGETIEINESTSFSIQDSSYYRIHFGIIEWDGGSADDRMRTEDSELWHVADGINLSFSMGAGSAGCLATLRGNATEE